jgi:hypothetical protein
VGKWKCARTKEVRAALAGSIWGEGGKYKPVKTRQHLRAGTSTSATTTAPAPSLGDFLSDGWGIAGLRVDAAAGPMSVRIEAERQRRHRGEVGR